MSSSDSEDINPSDNYTKRIKMQVQTYQSENHQLKKENISLKSQFSSLKTEFDSKLKIMEIKYKQELEETQRKLKMAEKNQNSANEKLLKQQQEASISASNQLQDLQDEVSSLTSEKEKLISKITVAEESKNNEKKRLNMKIAEFQQNNSILYNAASKYFGSSVFSHDDLIDLMNEFVDSNSTEATIPEEFVVKVKKLKKRVKELKNALKSCLIQQDETEKKTKEKEEELLKSKDELTKSAFMASKECNELKERNEELENNLIKLQQKLDIAIKERDQQKHQKVNDVQNVQPVCQKEYIVKSIDSELQEDLLKQISKLTKKLISKQKKQHALVRIIREHELTIQELEANNENKEYEVENEKRKSEELEEQLKEAVATIQSMKETGESCKMKEFANRKIKRQQVKIDDQNEEIKRLLLENDKLKNEYESQKVAIQRLETELSLCNNREEENEKQMTIKEIVTEPTIDWEMCEDIPYELDGRIKEIINNQSLSLSSKMKMVLDSLTKYYNEKIALITNASEDTQRKLKKIEFTIKPFIEEIADVSLGRKVSFEALSESPETQSAIIKTISSNTHSVSEVSALQNKIARAQTEMHEMKKKLAKQTAVAKRIESEDSQANSIDLERLRRENAELRHQLEEQKENSNRRIKEMKFGMITDYENVINQFKERCSKQKKTIDDLMRQLSGAPTLSTTL